MRFISTIYVSSALFLAAWAAPASAPGAIAEARENFDTVVKARKPGGDVFVALDLTAREEIEVELRAEPAEAPGYRDPQSGGCIIV
ncbi:hypothetical protein C8R44DRAFT_876460 [Mycena epipterygia]|nr:hypothetical protein C8R44DRAFT_876460 [Mycena epipterygia]